MPGKHFVIYSQPQTEYDGEAAFYDDDNNKWVSLKEASTFTKAETEYLSLKRVKMSNGSASDAEWQELPFF